MKWQGRRGSSNIEDRRRMGPGKAGGIGGIGLIAVLLIGLFLGVDVTPFLQGGGGGAIQTGGGEITQADQDAAEFVSVTLADTEEIWSDLFATQLEARYSPTTLVLYKGTTQSPCGGASGATGPFYCPVDNKVYLDTAFFTTLSRQMGAKGDFAAAYVIAHEVAHHVQDELGILSQANEIRSQVSKVESNAISVRIELQADCFSGIWARRADARFGSLERGDIAEAMNAADKIGDDALMRSSGQKPMPHLYTHGTSEQRQRWFATGYQNPQLAACDTFGTKDL